MHKITRQVRYADLTRLLKQKTILEIAVEGCKYPFYIRSLDKPLLDSMLKPAKQTPRASIMAPLDTCSGTEICSASCSIFEYRWEVYKPVRKENTVIMCSLFCTATNSLRASNRAKTAPIRP